MSRSGMLLGLETEASSWIQDLEFRLQNAPNEVANLQFVHGRSRRRQICADKDRAYRNRKARLAPEALMGAIFIVGPLKDPIDWPL